MLIFKLGAAVVFLLLILIVLAVVKPFSGGEPAPQKTGQAVVDKTADDSREEGITAEEMDEEKAVKEEKKAETDRKNIKVKDARITAASSNHSAWIIDGKLQIAGESYENQDVIADWKNLVQVAISDEHIVALDKNGRVYATGSNAGSQCSIHGMSGVVYIDANADCSVAVMADGTIQVFGIMDPDRRQGLLQETEVKSVAVGVHHAVVLHNDGTVSAYGKNENGQCNVDKWKNIESISVGYEFSVGLTKKGKLEFAGNDQYDISKCENWSKIEAIEAGNSYVVAIDKKRAVVSAGRNRQGEGDVSAWEDIVSVAAGYDHTIALNKKGDFFAVGYNGMNQY